MIKCLICSYEVSYILVKRFRVVQQGSYDGLQHRLLHPSTHGSDVVHHDVEQLDVQVGAVEVGSVLVRINLCW